MAVAIRFLARDGPHAKVSEGFFRFVCPRCRQIRATVNPKNNLAHCFCCHRNFNNIDLLLSLGYDFKRAVALLGKWLKEYKECAGEPGVSDSARDYVRPDHLNRPMKLGDFLSRISASVGKG